VAEAPEDPLHAVPPDTLDGAPTDGEEGSSLPSTTLGGHISVQSLRNPQSVVDLGRECTGLHHVFGVDMSRKGDLSLIEDDTIVYVTATAVVFQNVHSDVKEYLLSIDDSGVGCVAVHPSRKMFAVGGKGYQPNLYIYSYPEKSVIKVLPGGAERGYACLDFSADGEKLASVSSGPDFMLTIWDWEAERMGLHSKAFGQDVYNVRFSKDDPGRLTTSGVGHIRFWKMASTFTGLKLQGAIGKFGKIDLSDIDTFVEMPDGKVVSSTETGSLLVWEGNFIKCRLTRTGGKLCHSGAVTYLSIDRVENTLISAAQDGYIRWWDFSTIDNAEVDSDHSMDFELEPIAEFYLGAGVGLHTMTDSGSQGAKRLLVILDSTGRMQSLLFSLHEKSVETTLGLCATVTSLKSAQLLKLADFTMDVEFVVDDDERFFVDKRVFEKFHSARVTGLDTCPADCLAATCSSDGTVRLLDYESRQVLAVRQFPAAATCLKWLPSLVDSTCKMVAVGFADGVVRVLSIAEAGKGQAALTAEGRPTLTFKRKMVFKPHNAPVSDLSFSSDGSMLATAGEDGIVFFFQVVPVEGDESATWTPVRFATVLPLEEGAAPSKTPVFAKQVSWSADDADLLQTCSDGVLREVDLRSLRSIIVEVALGEEVVSYEELFPIKQLQTRVPASIASADISKSTSSTTIAPAKADAEGGVTSASAEGGSPTDNAPAAPEPAKAADPAASTSPVASSQLAKITAAAYSLNRASAGFLCSATVAQRNFTFECDPAEELPLQELRSGLYSSDGKDMLKMPQTTSFRYSRSGKFLVTGQSDGVVTLRPTKFLEIFARAVVHSTTGNGVSLATTSFDDRYLLSVGADSTMVVRRVRLDLFKVRAEKLFKDADAGVFGSLLVKPAPAAGKEEPEPLYMGTMSSFIQSTEDSLFAVPTSAVAERAAVLAAAEAADGKEEKDVSAGTYSIQDNRLKFEEDAKKVAAEELKGRVRASILALQRDYKNIVNENVSIPDVTRLDATEMLVDREYLEILEAEGKGMVEEVHRECEHEAEKAEALLKKLRSRVMQGLLMEETTLSAFCPPTGRRIAQATVKSFRAKGVDSHIQDVLKEVHEMVKAAELRAAQIRTNETAQRKASEAIDQLMHRLHKGENHQGGDVVDPGEVEAAAALAQLDMKDAQQAKAKMGEMTAEALAAESSVAARRLKRIERKEGMKKHLTEKPNEDEDDVRDLNAIRLAEKTIGDYKLKCAEDYEVPEEQRSNANKKIRQMAMLEESMLNMRLQFNERFLALRNLKRQMIYAIRRDNKRMKEIDEALEQPEKSSSLWEPTFDPLEFPDDADEVTEPELTVYSSQRADASWLQVAPPQQVVVTGTKTEIKKNSKTGAYDVVLNPRTTEETEGSEEQKLENILSDEMLVHFTPARTDPPKFYEAAPSILKAQMKDARGAEVARLLALEQQVPSLMRIRKALGKRMHLRERKEAQQREINASKLKLEFERGKILKNMEDNVVVFGEAVDDLRTDRHSITSDLLMAELKLLVLFQEYQLLQTFENRDAALQQKQVRCKGEESEIKALASENKSKLDSKDDEIQHWVEKLNQITSEFKVMLPDTHAYCEMLTRIFKKKIKRNKGNKDGEDDEDYENEDGDDDDDEDDEEEVEDICPPGCDQMLFERILELREKRVDTEEVSADIQKGIEELKRTLARLKSREQQIIKEAQQTELEVQQFQLQKQAALNQISVVVPVCVSQVYMFETSGSLTGPTDKPLGLDKEDNLELVDNISRLKESGKRCLVADVDLKSHTLFSNQNLVRLKERIDELHSEIDEAKEDFRYLHRERGMLTKEREKQQKDIETWSARCRDLQMLKFGKEIDLDELEATSDRSKEREAEALLVDDAEKFKMNSSKLARETTRIEEALMEVTRRNTQLLSEVAELKEMQSQTSKELNAPGQIVTHTSKLDNFREVEEQKRITAYIKFQATELDSLRAELNMLKRKEAPPMLGSAEVPQPPRPGSEVLPPIARR